MLLDEKPMVNLNIYHITNWETNNYNTHITQYLRKQRKSGNEIWSVNKILENDTENEVGRLALVPFSVFQKSFV